MSAPIPSFEDQIPMPDFLYPNIPGLVFDHGEDAACPKSVPLPFVDLIDLYHPEFAVGTAADHPEGIPPGEGSVGVHPPTLMRPGARSTINSDDGSDHTSAAKPTASVNVMQHYEPRSSSP